MTKEELANRLQSERNFAAYLRLLGEAKRHFAIFVAVSDTGAGPYFTPELSTLMMQSLGTRINMLKRYRAPYIAIIANGRVIREMTSDKIDAPLVVNGKLNAHDVRIYSAGFEYQYGIGMGAHFFIDEADYASGARGFNFLVFDMEKDDLIDTCAFDGYAMAKYRSGGEDCSPALLKFAQTWGGGRIVRAYDAAGSQLS